MSRDTDHLPAAEAEVHKLSHRPTRKHVFQHVTCLETLASERALRVGSVSRGRTADQMSGAELSEAVNSM